MPPLAEAPTVTTGLQRTYHLGGEVHHALVRFASAAMVLAALVVVSFDTASAQTAKPELEWAPCGDVPDTECAEFPVPIDYAAPAEVSCEGPASKAIVAEKTNPCECALIGDYDERRTLISPAIDSGQSPRQANSADTARDRRGHHDQRF
jgi:hypothetical protein